MILDTTFIIDLMNKDDGAIQKSNELMGAGETQIVTALTVFELFSGIAQSNKSEEEKNKVLKYLNGQMIINLNREAAQEAGDIDGTLTKQGQMIPPIDCLIAGITLTRGEKLVTRNQKDFSKVKGLQMETY